ncbi:MAG TPA: tetratricopeptide repeat protein [Negativicutes bacterium]|nr:tetratricopeptide repeat protein [Negativicutes bacterium]
MSGQSDYFALAKKALREERADEAVALFKQGLAIEPDNFAALWTVALYHEQHAQFVEAAGYYLRLASLPKGDLPPEALALADRAANRANIFYWAGVELVRRRDFAAALVYFRHILSLLPGNIPSLYLAGICCLRTGDISPAAGYFRKAVSLMPAHVDAWFNMGNALQLAGRAADAAACYRKALTLEPDFAEAFYNLGLLLDGAKEYAAARRCFDTALKLEPHLQLPGDEVGAKRLKFRYWKACKPPADFFAVPIFINCRDRVSPLKQLVDWLLAAGYRNLILLDNVSSYPPLLGYYGSLADDGRVRVVRLAENLGQTALWRGNILKKMKIETPFVYTDCDVVPCEECPADVVEVFYRILMADPMLQKVGFGLKIDDIPDRYGPKAAITDHERQFWRYRLADKVPEQYWATIDTTFALYRHGNYHLRNMESIRTGHPYLARHTDWYLDTSALGEEERYYFQHADKGVSSTKKALDEAGLL